ncbi:MAG: helix-turn-helix domain-containing protein [Candidatus Thorarchaeota archaeon]
MVDEYDVDKVKRSVTGTTLEIYFKMVNSGKAWSARELQREMNLSSPSLSLYHLNKLIDASLVRIEDGLYVVSKVVRVGILRWFLQVRNQLIPRFLCYSVLFGTILLLYPIVIGIAFHPTDLVLVFVLIFGIVVFSFEGWWIIRYGIEK